MTGAHVRWLALVLIPLLVACERPSLPPDAAPTIEAAIAATATAVARLPAPTPTPAVTAPAATRTPIPTSTRAVVVASTPRPIIAVAVTEADYLEAWRAIRLDVRASLKHLSEWCPWSGSSKLDQDMALLLRASEFRIWQEFAPRLRGLKPPAKFQPLHTYNTAALEHLAQAGQSFLVAESPEADSYIATTGIRTGMDAYVAFLTAIGESEAELRNLGLEEIGPAGLRIALRRSEGVGTLDLIGCTSDA